MARDEDDSKAAGLHVHPCTLPVSRPQQWRGSLSAWPGWRGSLLCEWAFAERKVTLFSCLPSWEQLALGLTRVLSPRGTCGQIPYFPFLLEGVGPMTG